MGAQVEVSQNDNVPLSGGTLFYKEKNYSEKPQAAGVSADFFAYFLL
jgi:hypothetical protein